MAPFSLPWEDERASLPALLIPCTPVLQKELCQKDRHLQQHQTKLDEMLRQLSEASYQQVGRTGLPWELAWLAQVW